MNPAQLKIFSVLPTERYLKKFLNNKVPVDPDYTLSRKDKFGSYLFMCMQDSCYKVELNNKRFNEKIKIIVPVNYEKAGKLDLTEERIHFANQFLRLWFYEDFITIMSILDAFNMRMDRSIQFFCDIYKLDLDIDINYETLKKKYYRWRENKGQPLQKYLVELIQEE